MRNLEVKWASIESVAQKGFLLVGLSNVRDAKCKRQNAAK